jgi:lipopolysaccharide export system permease protein
MRLLDRYQLRELLTAFGFCLLGILVFWTSFELLGEMEDLRRREAGAMATVEYLIHRLPLHLLVQIPVALLLSLLYVLTQHARHNEFVAMRAAGIGLLRISLPYHAVGVALSLGVMALNEYAVPDAAERAEAALAGTGPESDRAWRRNINFRDTFTGRVWSLAAFQPATGELRGAHVQWRGEEGGREELLAERGRWEEDAWVFEGVTRFSFAAEPGSLPVQVRTNRLVVADFPETPAHLRSEVKISRLLGSLKKSRQVQLSLAEIRTYRELHPRLSPQFEALLRTWFQDRLASPWTCLVVVLIAIPAAAGSGRRNVFVGVAAAVFLAFGYFVLKEFSLALGSGGYVPAWVAAWAPNLLFGGAGLLATRRVR